MSTAATTRSFFVQGAISPAFIAELIGKHNSKHAIGAHSIFLGQVRADVNEGRMVTAIEYEAYPEMADAVIHALREASIPEFSLTCLHIYHSLGVVEVGGICLFVFCSSPHRKAAVEACSEIVERIKREVPVWGKEIFNDDSTTWKTNR